MESIFIQAQRAHRSGNFQRADELYTHFLEKQPDHPDALHLSGIVKSQLGKPDEAVRLIGQAIQKKPHPMFYHNLGKVYADYKKFEEAIKNYRIALRLSPDFTEAIYNYGNALKAIGNYSVACQQYKKIVRQEPRHFQAYYNWGNTLIEQGKFKESIEVLKSCLEIKPDYDKAWNNLGLAQQQLERETEALASYEESLRLNKNQTEAYKNLVGLHGKMGNQKYIRKYLQLWKDQFPENRWLDWQIRSLNPTIFSSNEQIDKYFQEIRELVEEFYLSPPMINPKILNDHGFMPPFVLPYLGRNVRPLRELYGRFFEEYFQKLRPRLHKDKLVVKTNKNPHIGFVVTAGHEGVFIKCMRGIINQLNPDKLQISIVCSAPNGQAILKKHFETFVEFINIPKELQIAFPILRQAQLDVAHFWEIGTDSTNYLLPFFRIAPVQCCSWGWPITSGIPQMDYYLSCQFLEPEYAEAHYTEDLILFKKLPAYYFKPRVPADLKAGSEFGFDKDQRIYLCNQNLRKVHPDMDPVFLDIIDRDPQAVIVFINDKHENFTHLLQGRLKSNLGHKYEKVVFVERMKEGDYLNLLSISDVILDTFYYTGGANTSYDAFACGTPYVTLKGPQHRGRFGSAAYWQIGMNDCIAETPEEYADLALKIAMDEGFRQKTVEKIKVNAHLVFEDREAVVELEEFFLAAVKKRP